MKNKEAKFCRECGKPASSSGFCSPGCVREYSRKLQPKVYCKNCRHWKRGNVPLLLWLGLSIAVISSLYMMFAPIFNIAYPVTAIGGILLMVFSEESGEQYCSLRKKEYQKTDTPEEHIEELVTLTHDDLNKDNHCQYYEVK